MPFDDIVSKAVEEGRLSVLESEKFNGKRLWTVAFVNYKTSTFLKWQLKILFEFNNPEEFCVIIVDNSLPHEREPLRAFLDQYADYNNIKVVFYQPKAKSASGQHGEGLTVAMKMASSTFFLANDPDFFWVKQGYLKWMAALLDSGFVGVGAPYTNGVGIGHPMFPALWGAAHRLSDINHLDCFAEDSPKKLTESLRKYPGLDYSFDVGWKIRKALSNDGVLDFVSFSSKIPNDFVSLFGEYSYDCLLREYLYNMETVAFHLFRGSFTQKVVGVVDINVELTEKILSMRDLIGGCFYDLIATGKRPHLSFFKQLKFWFKKLLKNIKSKNKNKQKFDGVRLLFLNIFLFEQKKYRYYFISRLYCFGIRILKIVKSI